MLSVVYVDCIQLTFLTSNNKIFTSNLPRLPSILSPWDGNSTGGLTLEVSALSASGTEHFFHGLELEDGYPFNHGDDLENNIDFGDYPRGTFKLNYDLNHMPRSWIPI